jgi:hypothetical protein
VVNTQIKIQEMENNMNDNRENMENKMEHMEKNMDESRDQMENKMYKKMEELQNSMSKILLHTLHERFPQGDIREQGNHVNVEEINIEPQNHDYSLPPDPHDRGFHSAPRNYLSPKINMRKFDGKDPITWIL